MNNNQYICNTSPSITTITDTNVHRLELENQKLRSEIEMKKLRKIIEQQQAEIEEMKVEEKRVKNKLCYYQKENEKKKVCAIVHVILCFYVLLTTTIAGYK